MAPDQGASGEYQESHLALLLRRSDQPALREAHVAAAADDDVVVDAEPEEARALDELPSEVDVFLRRGRIA